MKRNFTSAGMVALGVLGLCTAGAQEKPWNLSAKLRTFYDDNYATLPAGAANRDDSFGIEVNPVARMTTGAGPTAVQLIYDYRMRFFEGRGDSQIDNQHLVTFDVKNKPDDRTTLTFKNVFAYAQEPGVNETVITSAVKTEGSYFNNRANLGLQVNLNERVGLETGYENVFYDYEQDNDTVIPVGARSALLDRVEHYFNLSTRWKVQPTLDGIVGYRYGAIRQTSEDLLATGVAGRAAPGNILPNERDADTHFAFVGADKRFTDVLAGSLRVGIQFTDFPNAQAGASDSAVNPFADSSVTYRLPSDGSVRLGVKHARNQTDVAFAAGSNPTLDSETTTLYGTVNSRLFGQLSGGLVFQYQRSSFNGGSQDSKIDNLAALGANLKYNILPNRLVAETGYSFERLDSDITGRSFSRNRVYIGLSATY